MAGIYPKMDKKYQAECDLRVFNEMSAIMKDKSRLSAVQAMIEDQEETVSTLAGLRKKYNKIAQAPVPDKTLSRAKQMVRKSPETRYKKA